MPHRRLEQLLERARSGGFETIVLMPGPNLFYFTGMTFHISERPVLAIFKTDGRAGAIVPVLESTTTESAVHPATPYAYSDEAGYEPAFAEACAALDLAGQRIGVEALQMRFLEMRALERHAPGCELLPAEDLLADLRMCKDATDIAAMRQAIEFTQDGLDAAVGQIKAGMTEREVVSLLTMEMLRAGAERLAFAPLVVAGPNAASPHASASDRRINPGETIVIDCGAAYAEYNGDITRTFSVGPLDAELAQVYEIVKAANQAGRDAVRPGVTAESIDQAARAVIDGAGYGEFFFHRTGHGLGLEIHEPPYMVAGNQLVLTSGMVFTVEPGIYLPGRGGVRVEDDVLVTESGGESLTTFPRKFRAL